MSSKFQIGDFGLCEFISRPKRGIKNWFHIYVTVIDIDDGNVLLQDNEDFMYLVKKRI